jgi:hypothetical protein
MTPSRGDTHDLFETDKVRVWLSIGKGELPLRLASQRGVATPPHCSMNTSKNRPHALVRIHQAGGEGLKPLLPPSEGAGRTPDQAWQKDEATLAKLTLPAQLLQGRHNGIWAPHHQDAFAPVFLAPFDTSPAIRVDQLANLRKATARKQGPLLQHGLFVHKGMDTIMGNMKKTLDSRHLRRSRQLPQGRRQAGFRHYAVRLQDQRRGTGLSAVQASARQAGECRFRGRLLRVAAF